MRLGTLRKHPAIARLKYDVNNHINAGETYHLILAANSIHIAKNVKESMKHLFDALEEGRMMLCEEAICSDALYLHGLDKFMWKTANDKQSFGLWMSWTEWVDLIDSIDGLELIVLYRRPTFVSMLLHKVAWQNDPTMHDQDSVTVQSPVITADINEMNQSLNAKLNVVYCELDSESVIKSMGSDREKILVETFPHLGKAASSEHILNPKDLQLRFNVMNSEGKLNWVQ